MPPHTLKKGHTCTPALAHIGEANPKGLEPRMMATDCVIVNKSGEFMGLQPKGFDFSNDAHLCRHRSSEYSQWFDQVEA